MKPITLTSYCPMSLLSFATKQNCPPFFGKPTQSGFFLHQSTKTTLIKIIKNIHIVKSKGQFLVILFLQLLSAFQKADPSLFHYTLYILAFWGSKLSWISSLLLLHFLCLLCWFFLLLPNYYSDPGLGLWSCSLAPWKV